MAMGLDSILSTLWRQSYGFDSIIVTSSPDILEKMRVATQQAFSEWQRNSEFTFVQNPPGAKSDIMIGFHLKSQVLIKSASQQIHIATL
jgi:hypothetical protein